MRKFIIGVTAAAIMFVAQITLVGEGWGSALLCMISFIAGIITEKVDRETDA